MHVFVTGLSCVQSVPDPKCPVTAPAAAVAGIIIDIIEQTVEGRFLYKIQQENVVYYLPIAIGLT